MTEVVHGGDMAILTVHVVERDGVLVVSVGGELDMATVQQAIPVLDDAVTRGRPIVIDLTGLTFFASTGLAMLARLDEQRRNEPVDVRLVAAQRAVVLPLRLTGLHNLFPLYTTLDDALTAIRQVGRPG